MRGERKGLGRRGATAVFIAVSLAALLGMVALAVDVGMFMKTRSDAQRSADAAALAGAQEFLKGKPADMKVSALNNALEYASRNYVGWQYVDTSGKIVTDSGVRLVANTPEAYVQVIPDSQRVRVFIRRAGTATWFGHLLGIDFVKISVKAAAEAVNAGTGKCVKPFAIPDLWQDNNDDNNPTNRLPDIVGTQGKQGGEDWEFDPTDVYSRYEDPSNPNSSQWTGLGSSWRNNSYYGADQSNPKYYWDDYGRPMTIKVSNPQESPSPGFFYPWVMPYDSTDPSAYPVGLNPGPGANWYRWNISHCNPLPVEVLTVETLDPTTTDEKNKPGNMIGPTNQGIDSLIAQDPHACWAEFPDTNTNHTGHTYTTGEVRKRSSQNGPCDQPYPGWENSPRTAMVPLFDPGQISSGRTTLNFNNLAVIFIEGQKTPHDPVTARFLYFAKSTGPLAPNTGSLIKKLQLVE
jgi:hypothetical protein